MVAHLIDDFVLLLSCQIVLFVLDGDRLHREARSMIA